jgi:hypothetical protein
MFMKKTALPSTYAYSRFLYSLLTGSVTNTEIIRQRQDHEMEELDYGYREK